MSNLLIINEETKEFVNIDSINSVMIASTANGFGSRNAVSVITVNTKWHDSPFTPEEILSKINEIQNPDKSNASSESDILFKETGRTRTKYLRHNPNRIEEFAVELHNSLDDCCMVSPYSDYDRALKYYKELNLD